MRNRWPDRLTDTGPNLLLTRPNETPNICQDKEIRRLLTMNPRRLLLLFVTGLGGSALLAQPVGSPLLAQSTPSLALRGHVKSAEEPAMEGVIVTAKKTGATIATSVVTNSSGDFEFPAARLEPGSYALQIRAAGFDLTGAGTVSVEAGHTAVSDLTLEKTKNLTSQLTNAEWLASFPGTAAQKTEIRGCAHCHSLELITRSRHDAAEFVKIVERMSGYPPLAFPRMPQRTPAPRIGGGEVPRDRQLQTWQRQADYLATLNLSGGNGLTYPLKTEPRPSAAATRVIYTTYDLPKPTRQPHDVIVDSQGMVWYASFGEQ